MLSQDLRNLCEELNQHTDTGIELRSDAIITICAVLATAAEDARQLETSAVKPADVIDFIGEKSRRDAADWLQSQGLKIPLHLIAPQGPEGAV